MPVAVAAMLSWGRSQRGRPVTAAAIETRSEVAARPGARGAWPRGGARPPERRAARAHGGGHARMQEGIGGESESTLRATGGLTFKSGCIFG